MTVKSALVSAAFAAGLVAAASAPAGAATPQIVLDFVKDHGKELLTYPSKLSVLTFTLPEINNIGECYAGETVLDDSIGGEVPGAKGLLDHMISCKADIDDAVLAIAAKDSKYGAQFKALIQKGEDIPEEVLETVAKDIGAEVPVVEGKIKGEESKVAKLVAAEVTKEGLQKAEAAAAYVAAKVKAQEELREKEIAAEADAAKKEMMTATHAINKVTNKTIVDAKKAGTTVVTVAKKSISALKHFFHL